MKLAKTRSSFCVLCRGRNGDHELACPVKRSIVKRLQVAGWDVCVECGFVDGHHDERCAQREQTA